MLLVPHKNWAVNGAFHGEEDSYEGLISYRVTI